MKITHDKLPKGYHIELEVDRGGMKLESQSYSYIITHVNSFLVLLTLGFWCPKGEVYSYKKLYTGEMTLRIVPEEKYGYIFPNITHAQFKNDEPAVQALLPKRITREEYISKIPERVFIDFCDDIQKNWSLTVSAVKPFISKEKISYWIDKCVLDFNKQISNFPS